MLVESVAGSSVCLTTPDLLNLLRCPNCRGALTQSSQGAKCSQCQIDYPISPTGQLDLRLKQKKTLSVRVDLTVESTPLCSLVSEKLPFSHFQKAEFVDRKVDRLSAELASYFPVAKDKQSFMLDLGCGSTLHRPLCERAGFKYIGLDYNSLEATVLGDAHSLPFEDESLDFVLSIAVLEHLRYPFIALSEVHRVLKKQGKFIGSVAFLEPHHGDSFYHFTHLGLINCLEYAQFRIEQVAPTPKWDVLTAQASMALFPKMPLILIQLMLAPLRAAQSIWWKIGSSLYPRARDLINNSIRTAGAFEFIAEKL
jgi:SAM-dependent methyltransferase